MGEIILTGDVNLMNVTDPQVPFRRVRDFFAKADVVFSNFESCLYRPASGHSVGNEGFPADPEIGGEALRYAGIAALGLANNVNYGDAAITASVAKLDALGIPHTGAGRNLAAARAPAIVRKGPLSVGFLQRSSVYWPTNHEARNDAPGIAVLRGHTAYHVPMYKTRAEVPPPNRPGLPPDIITWADPAYLASFVEDIKALRPQVDVVVASCHWGLGEDVLQYMRDIAHAAIDAGADIVVGHGPHFSLPLESYKGRPIFYGLGSFSFHTGHGGRKHGDWVGMMAHVGFSNGKLDAAAVQFVRHNDDNETFVSPMIAESEIVAKIIEKSAALGARADMRSERLELSLHEAPASR
jgi:poly-gamma-glutamate capsule biosynthesis protein CapA/YwtB (metallophosphatase superfamily)